MIEDLGILLITAACTSLICKILRQPAVLGYIIAGLFVGPHAFGEAWVETHSIENWGQIGVIFLLFAMGLEFSFKKLLKVGTTALLGCATIVTGMMTLGVLIGQAMGWNEINSLFLGGMLCMSSTTIVYKALDDMGLRKQKFSGICFGILVIEDLFAVVLMVVLSSIAVSNSFQGTLLFTRILELVMYLLFWFVSGITLIPTLLKHAKRYLNDETLTIVSLGLCLGMVMLAKKAGFSEALGAFVMGSLLAETLEVERIEHLTSPVKNLFGAIFFVSVGMMIDPQMLIEYWVPITVLTVTVVMGQIIFATTGIVLAGNGLKTGIRASFALVQVGEFAFIIAQFGQHLGVTEPSLYPIIVAVSVITTFLTPYIIKCALPAYSLLERILPATWLEVLGTRHTTQASVTHHKGVWKTLLRKIFITTFSYYVVTVFVAAIYSETVSEFIIHSINSLLPESWSILGKLVSLTISILLISPGIFRIATSHIRSHEAKTILKESTMQKGTLIIIFILRVMLCVMLIVAEISAIINLTTGFLFGLAIIIASAILMGRHVKRASNMLEYKFHQNLSAREAASEQASQPEQTQSLSAGFTSALEAFDLHIEDFLIDQTSDMCGKTLSTLRLRDGFGITVVRIIRCGKFLNVPGGNTRLYAGDKLCVAGSDEQLKRFEQHVLSQEHPLDMTELHDSREEVTLERFMMTEKIPFLGKTIEESRIQARYKCVILGIIHDGMVTMNPDAKTPLRMGDIIMVATIKQDLLKALSIAD